MVSIVGVRFRNIGKVYYFAPGNLEVKAKDHVIVETSKGIEYGKVVFSQTQMDDDKPPRPLKEICRIATEEDERKAEENRLKEKEAYKVCVEKIHEHGLEMKLIDVEYAFDGSKILFYFTADERIDFRQLVKDLASIFKTRIELRQIGVRDETKILGGIGTCGRPLCCHSYLTDFVPVSIRMAKEQNLSLNQSKISGVCGRLMCCLKNEQETYEELNRKLPTVGDTVMLDGGTTTGKVHSVNVLRQLVKVTIEVDDEKELIECSVDELDFKPKKKKGKGSDKNAASSEEKEEEVREETKNSSGKNSRRKADKEQQEKNVQAAENEGKEISKTMEADILPENGKGKTKKESSPKEFSKKEYAKKENGKKAAGKKEPEAREKKEGTGDAPDSEEENAQGSFRNAERRNRKKRSSYKGSDEQGRNSTHRKSRINDNGSSAKRTEHERGSDKESSSGQEA